MKISVTIKNGNNTNDITVSTEASHKKITIPAKVEGIGSSVNGGELLFLALATCFCNDIYREAARRKDQNDDLRKGSFCQLVTYHIIRLLND